jgi:hypothetical protein
VPCGHCERHFSPQGIGLHEQRCRGGLEDDAEDEIEELEDDAEDELEDDDGTGWFD